MQLTSREFAALVEQALASLPHDIAEKMENVAIVIQDYPTRDQIRRTQLPPGRTLFGLYEGVPLTQRTAGYTMVPPDRITIFRGPILAACRNAEQVREIVARTVIHEIAHHFGISDEHLRYIGRY